MEVRHQSQNYEWQGRTKLDRLNVKLTVFTELSDLVGLKLSRVLNLNSTFSAQRWSCNDP